VSLEKYVFIIENLSSSGVFKNKSFANCFAKTSKRFELSFHCVSLDSTSSLAAFGHVFGDIKLI
jgi:hypothetical protein